MLIDEVVGRIIPTHTHDFLLGPGRKSREGKAAEEEGGEDMDGFGMWNSVFHDILVLRLFRTSLYGRHYGIVPPRYGADGFKITQSYVFPA